MKESIQIEDWTVEPKEAASANAKFDLNMMIEDDGAYKVTLEYGAELFDDQTIERMLTHYMEILNDIAQQPEKNIGDIDITTADERTQVLETFNDTYKDMDNRRTFIDHFEAQVKRTPDRKAITYNGESMTYAELNAKANQLGHYLRGKGVKPNTLVGMLTNRTLDMMVGIYGILKAGGAYVPVDPNNPTDRINFMLEDSQPSLLLTDSPLDTAIQFDNEVIDLTAESIFTESSEENLEQVTNADDLMYIIYTSGTTGKPKGVIVSYEGVMNRINWMIDEFNIDSKDIVLFKTLYTFDVSVWKSLALQWLVHKLCYYHQVKKVIQMRLLH